MLADSFGTCPACPDEVLHVKERKRFLEDMIRRLPPQQQVAFRMAHQADMSYEHIGAVMGISRNTVRNHIARALHALRFQVRSDADDLS